MAIGVLVGSCSIPWLVALALVARNAAAKSLEEARERRPRRAALARLLQ